MNNLNLISNFAEFKELKNIDKSTMIEVLEDVFRHALQKQYGTDENFDVIINADKGDLEIWRNRVVVADEEFEDDVREISLSQIQAIDPSYEVGDEYTDPITFESFGRRAVLCMRNTATASARLSLARFIRYGRRRCSSLMMTITSLSCHAQSKSQASSTTRATL